jgi:hypothetical protein
VPRGMELNIGEKLRALVERNASHKNPDSESDG